MNLPNKNLLIKLLTMINDWDHFIDLTVIYRRGPIETPGFILRILLDGKNCNLCNTFPLNWIKLAANISETDSRTE